MASGIASEWRSTTGAPFGPLTVVAAAIIIKPEDLCSRVMPMI